MGIEPEERDFFEERFSEEELRLVIGERPVSLVFSWNSPSFKNLGLSREDLDDDRLICLMLEEPRLIRRPLIQRGSEPLIVGANKEALSQAFSETS